MGPARRGRHLGKREAAVNMSSRRKWRGMEKSGAFPSQGPAFAGMTRGAAAPSIRPGGILEVELGGNAIAIFVALDSAGDP